MVSVSFTFVQSLVRLVGLNNQLAWFNTIVHIRHTAETITTQSQYFITYIITILLSS